MESTYPPLLEYLEATPYPVHHHANIGPRSIWPDTVNQIAQGNYYVVTDPDVVPIEECPSDAIDFFYNVLQLNPDLVKVGFSLKVDDIPDHYQFKSQVINWEGPFWAGPDQNNLYNAPVDTTFALYRPNSTWSLHPARRSAYPYMARHLSWYIDSNNPSEEDVYYNEHASSVSSWGRDNIDWWFPR